MEGGVADLAAVEGLVVGNQEEAEELEQDFLKEGRGFELEEG